MTEERKKLAKNIAERKLSGVCSGIADYLAIDANLIRLIMVFLAVFTGGAAFLGYIVAALILPIRDQDKALGRKTSLLSVVFIIILFGVLVGLFLNS
jgi:phage shock protein PspC (stress-responsive transcriptional regulator)